MKAAGVQLSTEGVATLKARISEARQKAPEEAKAVFQKAVAAFEKIAATPAGAQRAHASFPSPPYPASFLRRVAMSRTPADTPLPVSRGRQLLAGGGR